MRLLLLLNSGVAVVHADGPDATFESWRKATT
jgi:hypothetical protein